MTPASPATGTGLGKILLGGEHAAVYGHPALAVAIDRQTTATIEPCTGPTTIEAPFDDERTRLATRAVLGAEGWHAVVSSTIPVGRGLGSSAALGVALARAWSHATRSATSDAEIIERAMRCERVFHGDPSGVDVAVSVAGGVLRFQRDRVPVPLRCPPASWQLVVLDSGRQSSTAEQVARVRRDYPRNADVLQTLGDLAEQMADAFRDASTLGALFLDAHRLLGVLGVGHGSLDELVALACEAGAHGAKLSGAGGGGIVVAVTEQPDRLLTRAKQQGIDAFGCSVCPT